MSYNALRSGRYSESGRDYFVTAATYRRQPLFADLYAARALIAELRRLQEDRWVTWLAWVVMPDHFHGLLTLGGSESLSSTMNMLKGRSARALNLATGCAGSVWQPGFFDRALHVSEDRQTVAWYIVGNPIRAGLAANIGDYSHWDSAWQLW